MQSYVIKVVISFLDIRHSIDVTFSQFGTLSIVENPVCSVSLLGFQTYFV